MYAPADFVILPQHQSSLRLTSNSIFIVYYLQNTQYTIDMLLLEAQLNL